jgi:LacI family transcriptional regulator
MKAPQPRVTLREVAAQAGVHFSTASLALRNSLRLNALTREKVKRIAREMGYEPDAMLSSLNAYRLANRPPGYKATIGWISSWPNRDDLLAIRAFTEYYQGACIRAKEAGYAVEEFRLRDQDMTPTILQRILKARGIQGLLMPPQPSFGMPPPLDFTNYCAVAFGYTMQPSVLHMVTNHQFHTIKLMMDHLYELGYRRVGVATSTEWDAKVGNAWLAGLLVARRKYPEMKILSPVLNNHLDLSLDKLLTTHHLEVFVSLRNDLSRMRELGYSIPGDIGFAGLDVSKSDEEISGVYQNDLLIGKKAVDILVGMVQRNERGFPDVPVTTLVEGEWRAGATLKRLMPGR